MSDTLAEVIALMRDKTMWEDYIDYDVARSLAFRIEMIDAEMLQADNEIAVNGIAMQTKIGELMDELAACRLLLADPRVRALFPPLPDGTVLASCSGDVHETQE